MSNEPFKAPSIQSISALFPAFDFDHLIAQGGMGAVYLARQRSLDRNVAIKILPREHGKDPLFRKSFEAEAKAMARVVHPNLIAVYDSGDVDGLLYIVMEYVPGKSLHCSAHQKAVDPKQSVEIIMGICRGLAEAHNHGIVHRDIKPANILLTPKRIPKIGDFGLARAAGHDSEGIAMGTPGYAAPEIINHPELSDRRSDIFAVGVMLRELLTGCPPGNDPQQERGITDSELLDICKKATDPDPRNRYHSADALIADLKAWHQEPESFQKPASSPEPTSSPQPAKQDPIVDRSASSALGRNLALIIVLLAAIYGAWNLLEKKKSVTAAMIDKPAPANVLPPKPKLPKPAPPSWPEPATPSIPDTPASPPVIAEAPIETPAETPAQSLIRLRAALAAGNFGELPVGTLTHGNSYYFFVSRSTTWREASLMARSFGGHLPILTDEVLRTWLADAIPLDSANDPTKQATWIGATRTSPELWQMVNAVPWQLDPAPQGGGDFAALQRDGSVHAETKSETHPFFIQWHRDGSNPTDIEQILTRCKQSQDSAQPFFPPGIKTLGERSFLIVEEALTYDDARRMAKVGGGQLMTAASEEEADWLNHPTNTASAPDGLWLGATLQNGLWTWNSFEPWTFARWAPQSNPGSGDALLFYPGSGWAAADPSDLASGFIIEWSKDQLSDEPPAPADLLDEMEARAKKLLTSLDVTRQKALAENSEEYIWKLDVWLRRRGNKTEITRWTPGIQFLKAKVKNGRLPDDIPPAPNASYPAPLHEISRAYSVKQQALDLEFTYTAATYRDSYVTRLSDEADKLNELGQRERALFLSEKARAAADIKAWIESFGFTNG